MAKVAQRARPVYVPPETLRGQAWWIQPVLVVVVLTLFGLYALWAAAQGKGDCNVSPYFCGPYLSPFYSPKLPFGVLAPFFILWIPLGFRASCYYYRKAYYRSFFWDPPACVRPERAGRNYTGETRFPFILNNIHRYFLYLSIIVVLFLWYDALRSFDFGGHFGIGLGSCILLINVVLLSLYTFSCHSLRHWVGGGTNCFSCSFAGNTRHRLWKWVSFINPRHPNFAWFSLASLFVADVYIRLLIAGVLHDPAVVL